MKYIINNQRECEWCPVLMVCHMYISSLDKVLDEITHVLPGVQNLFWLGFFLAQCQVHSLFSNWKVSFFWASHFKALLLQVSLCQLENPLFEHVLGLVADWNEMRKWKPKFSVMERDGLLVNWLFSHEIGWDMSDYSTRHFLSNLSWSIESTFHQ